MDHISPSTVSLNLSSFNSYVFCGRMTHFLSLSSSHLKIIINTKTTARNHGLFIVNMPDETEMKLVIDFVLNMHMLSKYYKSYPKHSYTCFKH